MYANDLVMFINTMAESLLKMDLWTKTPRCQRNLSKLGKDLNNDKRKNLQSLKDSGKYSCGMRFNEVGSNSIF